MSARQFKATPGVRQPTPLFIGLVGPSSSGKTRSALRLAVGIQSVIGGEIAFINTEGRRGTADLGLFKKADGSPAIHLISFEAPYASLDYLEAITQARTFGAKTIVIDSLSHEHEQAGGMLDYQDQELTRMAGDDYRKRERMQMLAWAKPKAARRQLLTRGIMQTDVNIIACFRAKETSKPVKGPDGQNKVLAMGFVPIAGDEFVYEMALSALLPPGSKGVPNWHPELPGERLAVKRPDHLEALVPDGAQLSEEIGARLARWAAGDGPAPPAQAPRTADKPAPVAEPRQTASAGLSLAERVNNASAAMAKARDQAGLDATWSSNNMKALQADLEAQDPEGLLITLQDAYGGMARSFATAPTLETQDQY